MAENGGYVTFNAQIKRSCGLHGFISEGMCGALKHFRELIMNKNELIAAVADAADLTKAKAAEAVDAFIDAVSTAMAKGDEVRLVGFGTFAVVQRQATTGRNPRNGQVIKIAASKQPKFRPGKALKDQVNKSKKKAA
jgi:DNA-binding protein HU-beta